MKINTIDLINLKFAALFQFITDLLVIIKRIGADKLKITTQVDTLLIPALKDFDAAYKKERKSDFTDNLTALDKLRDKKISGMQSIVKTASFDSDEKKVGAAAKVKKWFGEFKGINKKPFKEQSAETSNLIQGLLGKYAPEVEILGLSKWLEELKEINDEITALFGERIVEKKEKGDLNTESAQKKLVAAYRTTIKLVEVFVETEGSANYDDFIKSVNILIAEYTGKKPAASPDTGTPTGETPTAPSTPAEDKYPDAKLWTKDARISESKEGDIFYVVVDENKVYYKLLDRYNVSKAPESAGTEAVWEKL